MRFNQIYVFFLFFSANLHAQVNFNNDFLVGSANELIYKTLQSGINIIQSDFIMFSPTSKQEYGRAGNKYFGRKYAIGVAVDSMVYLPIHILEPWKDDPFMILFDSLQPKLKVIKHKKLLSKEFDTVKVESDTYKNAIVRTTYNKSFTTSDTTISNGYLLIYHKIEDKDTFYVKPTLKRVKISSKGIDIIAEQISLENLLGCILFSELIDLGSITYHVVGQYEWINEKWVLKYLHQKKQVEKSKSHTELTPIGVAKDISPDKKIKDKPKKDKSKKDN